MGQYHLLVNLDRREYVYSHKLGDGLKAWEQFASGPGGVMSAAIYLMVCPQPRGGGDFGPGEFMGRWHGDRVTWVGDYAEKDDFDPITHDGVVIHPDIIYALCSDDRQDMIDWARERDQDEDGFVSRFLAAAEADLWFTNITEQVREAMTPELEGIITYEPTSYGTIARREPDRATTALKPDLMIGGE